MRDTSIEIAPDQHGDTRQSVSDALRVLRSSGTRCSSSIIAARQSVLRAQSPTAVGLHFVPRTVPHWRSTSLSDSRLHWTVGSSAVLLRSPPRTVNLRILREWADPSEISGGRQRALLGYRSAARPHIWLVCAPRRHLARARRTWRAHPASTKQPTTGPPTWASNAPSGA
jgi:hypothetical protein